MPKALPYHCDRGGAYNSREFQRLQNERNIAYSMGHRGDRQGMR